MEPAIKYIKPQERAFTAPVARTLNADYRDIQDENVEQDY
jgi:hypothetical protein